MVDDPVFGPRRADVTHWRCHELEPPARARKHSSYGARVAGSRATSGPSRASCPTRSARDGGRPVHRPVREAGRERPSKAVGPLARAQCGCPSECPRTARRPSRDRQGVARESRGRATDTTDRRPNARVLPPSLSRGTQ
jgi:hypothetical protein